MELRKKAPFGAVHFIVSLWQQMRPRKQDQSPSCSPPLTEHLARDIGLSPAEMERLHLRLPSETIRHPRL